MSGLGAFVSNFVQGGFEGYDWRQDRDRRKRDETRAEEDRTRRHNTEDTAAARAATRFDWETSDRAYLDRTRSAEEADKAALDQAYQDAYDATMGAAQPSSPTADMPSRVGDQDLRLPGAGSVNPNEYSFGAAAPGVSVPSGPTRADVAPAPAPTADASGAPAQPPAVAPPGGQPKRNPAAVGSAPIQPSSPPAAPMGGPSGAGPSADLPLRVGDQDLRLPGQGNVNPNDYLIGAGGAMPAQPTFDPNTSYTDLAAAARVPGDIMRIAQEADRLRVGLTTGTDPVTGRNIPTEVQAQWNETLTRHEARLAEAGVAPGGAPGVAPGVALAEAGRRAQAATPGARIEAPAAAPPGGQPKRNPAAVGGTTGETLVTPQNSNTVSAESETRTAQASQAALEGATSPSTQAVLSFGASMPRGVTEAQRERGTTAFMERYKEAGLPVVMQELVRQGRLEDAMKFQEFIEQDTIKAGMRDWAQAAFAISVGDVEGAGQHLLDAYNRNDYLPDGFSVDKENSGFTKDADGNLNGARITFVDENGTKFEQVFENPEDLLSTGIMFLDPVNAFEYHQRQAAAARGAVPTPREEEKELRGRVQTVVKRLAEDVTSGWNEMTADQRRERVAEELRLEDELVTAAQPGAAAAPEGPPPVAYRPEDGGGRGLGTIAAALSAFPLSPSAATSILMNNR